MQPPSPRLRQIACVLHAALIGLGAAATGGANALRGHDALRYGAVLGAGVLSVLHVLDPKWPLPRRGTTAWATALLIIASVAAGATTESAAGRLGIVILAAWCLACTLNAAAMVSMSVARPSEGESAVVSFRVAAALFLGVLGWAASVRIGRLQALLPAALAIVALGSLVTGGSRLEAHLRDRTKHASAPAAGLLLSGAWLAIAAIATASFTLAAIQVHGALDGSTSVDWALSTSKARLGWFHAFPLITAVLALFIGRFRLAGLGARSVGAPFFPVVLACVVFVAGTRFGLPAALSFGVGTALRKEAPPPVTSRPAAEVAREAAPTPPRPVPRVTSAEPTASAELAASSQPDASAAPMVDGDASAPTAAPATGSETIAVDSIQATGILEKDARSGLERRMNLLEECVTTSGLAKTGTLSARLSVDANGSVPTLRITGGDLEGTPFAVCAMRAFYRTGFASGGSPASIELTLRATPAR
jgi:hypothetical protein